MPVEGEVVHVYGQARAWACFVNIKPWLRVRTKNIMPMLNIDFVILISLTITMVFNFYIVVKL
jgi:hypothetical protein